MWPWRREKQPERDLFGMRQWLPLSDDARQMNQQAATIAAAVLREPVEAATRCEPIRFETPEHKPKFTGGDYTPYRRHTALPKTFTVAVTRSHVHVVKEKHQGNELIDGNLVGSWDRASFKARRQHETGNAAMGIPNDQDILILGHAWHR